MSNVAHNRRKPTAIDLFSGCGGLTLGLKDAGFRVIGAVEIDNLAVQTYSANHKRTHVWKHDIRKLTVNSVMKQLRLKSGDLDLLAGCPPCQGFSSMRTLNGHLAIEDEQNDLLFQFLRFVRVLQPRAVMMENVPGLEKDARFVRFCEQMRKLGYDGEHRILNAAKYGVPQRRRRLVYLAGRGRKFEFANPTGEHVTVRAAIGALKPAGKSGDALHDLPERRTKAVKDLIGKIPKDGGSRKDLDPKYTLECHKACDGFKDVYGRMSWDQPAPTITGGCFNPSKGRFLHPRHNRAITLREASILQGFPSSYQFPDTSSKSDVAVLIGNALPPAFVKAHAKKIMEALKQSGAKLANPTSRN